MMAGMTVEGVVREWHPEQGWGVIHAQDTPGGCWAHFSSVAIDGYRELVPGQAVTLEWEAVDQDGFGYRARRVWPAGAVPIDVAGETVAGAFSSSVTLSIDQAQ
jgi:CspA family cold shock protein